MYARCDTDPVDLATDVCDQCGSEYCDQHLVHPFGDTRPPLCRSCAVAVAGVRSGAAPPRRRSRGQIAKRRKELRQQVADRGPEEPDTFGLPPLGGRRPPATAEPATDAADDRPLPVPAAAAGIPSDPLDEDPVGANRPWRRWLRFGQRGIAREQAGSGPDEERRGRPDFPQPLDDEPFSSLGPGQPAATPSPTSATVLLTRLRESGEFPSAPVAPSAPPEPLVTAPEPLVSAPEPLVAVPERVVTAPEPLVAPPARPAALLAPPKLPTPPRPAPAGPVPQRPRLPAPAPTPPPVPGLGDGPNRLGSVFGRAASTPLLPPLHAGPLSEAEVDPDDPWSDVPPALRGPDPS